jgi:hypothetical protein
MTQQFITLKTFVYPTEAYPLQSFLENEGIACMLEGENMVSVDPFLSNAIGGIKLKVAETDYEKARELVQKIKTEEEAEKQKHPVPDDLIYVDSFCPECDTRGVYRKKMPFFKMIVAGLAALTGLAPAFITKRHYCIGCGHHWMQ